MLPLEYKQAPPSIASVPSADASPMPAPPAQPEGGDAVCRTTLWVCRFTVYSVWYYGQPPIPGGRTLETKARFPASADTLKGPVPQPAPPESAGGIAIAYVWDGASVFKVIVSEVLRKRSNPLRGAVIKLVVAAH